MYEIKQLESLSIGDVKEFGFNGFKTHTVYKVERKCNEEDFTIQLKKVKLNDHYIKEWNTSAKSLDAFSDILKEGHSIAIYKNNKMVGFGLLSYQVWNNSMWIENIRISERHQRKGIGKKLIKSLIEVAQNKSVRIIGLEAQSTNYPAIEFYKKCGFEISGVDFSRYPQRIGDREQVAVIMSRRIQK